MPNSTPKPKTQQADTQKKTKNFSGNVKNPPVSAIYQKSAAIISKIEYWKNEIAIRKKTLPKDIQERADMYVPKIIEDDEFVPRGQRHYNLVIFSCSCVGKLGTYYEYFKALYMFKIYNNYEDPEDFINNFESDRGEYPGFEPERIVGWLFNIIHAGKCKIKIVNSDGTGAIWYDLLSNHGTTLSRKYCYPKKERKSAEAKKEVIRRRTLRESILDDKDKSKEAFKTLNKIIKEFFYWYPNIDVPFALNIRQRRVAGKKPTLQAVIGSDADQLIFPRIEYCNSIGDSNGARREKEQLQVLYGHTIDTGLRTEMCRGSGQVFIDLDYDGEDTPTSTIYEEIGRRIDACPYIVYGFRSAGRGVCLVAQADYNSQGELSACMRYIVTKIQEMGVLDNMPFHYDGSKEQINAARFVGQHFVSQIKEETLKISCSEPILEASPYIHDILEKKGTSSNYDNIYWDGDTFVFDYGVTEIQSDIIDVEWTATKPKVATSTEFIVSSFYSESGSSSTTQLDNKVIECHTQHECSLSASTHHLKFEFNQYLTSTYMLLNNYNAPQNGLNKWLDVEVCSHTTSVMS
jgi:hypothetical protein